MADQPNIFLIVLDSLRADHAPPVTCQYMPTLADFASDAYAFENAVATGSWSVPSHASIFTGEYPSTHGATGRRKQLPDQSGETIADDLSSYRYRTQCVSANPWLLPEFSFDQGFTETTVLQDELPFPDVPDPRDVVTDSAPLVEQSYQIGNWIFQGNSIKRFIKSVYIKFSHQQEYASAEHVTAQVLKGLDQAIDPQFVFVNFMETHEPYFSDSDLVSWNLKSLSEDQTLSQDKIKTAYRNSVEEIDRYLDVFFDALRNRGLYENSLIAVLSDHGQALGEGGYWGHGTFLHDCLIDVPLLIRPPGGDGSTIESPWSLRHLSTLFHGVARGSDVGRLIDDTCEEIVVAESTGPHMDIHYPEEAVSSDGYRKYVAAGWRACKNLQTRELEISQNISEESVKSIQSQIDTLDEIHGLSFTDLEEKQLDVTDEAQDRLENLGYM